MKTNTKTKAGRLWKKRINTGGVDDGFDTFSEMDGKILQLLSPKIIEGHNIITESTTEALFLPHL